MYPGEVINLVCSETPDLVDCAAKFVNFVKPFHIMLASMIILILLVQMLFITVMTKKKGISYWFGVVTLDLILIILVLGSLILAPKIYTILRVI